jgi:hypothetical protein
MNIYFLATNVLNSFPISHPTHFPSFHVVD